MPTFLSESVEQTERALLGCILLGNHLWAHTDSLTVDDFCLDTHRRIYATLAKMFEDQRPADLITVTQELAEHNQLERCGGHAFVASLIDEGVPENIAAYVRSIRKAATERRVMRQLESMKITSESSSEDRLATLHDQAQRLQDLLRADTRGDSWKSLFHTYDEVMNAPEARFAIDGFLQEEGITLIGGLAGHGKTLCMLAMVRALLEGGKLFHHFPVTRPAERVIYLIPEAGRGPFSARLKTFNLTSYIRDERLFVRTLSAQGEFSLNDPRMLTAVEGADVFLDTAIRFMVGDENSSAEQKVFAETLFNLQRAGARTITGAHHAPKSFGKDSVMTLENVLRGSGDIGAMLVTCWGLSQVDAASNRIFVQNVKARDFLPCDPFIIQGRPSIDESGYFDLTEPPGFAGSFSDSKSKGGRPEIADDKMAEGLRLLDQGKSQRQVATAVGVSLGTVNAWAKKVQ